MSAQQQSLITPAEELVTIARLRKNMIVVLQNFGRLDFCKSRYVDGKNVGPGCGREIYWCTFRGDRPVPLDEDGSRHKCPEIKP